MRCQSNHLHLTRIRHCGKNSGCGFWLPRLCASTHPRKYFSCLARFRRYILGLNWQVQRVFPGSNPLFSGRGGLPRPAVFGVLKACLTQAKIVTAFKKHRKPPISGLCKLTKVLKSCKCFTLNGTGNSDSTTAKNDQGHRVWLVRLCFLDSD